MEKCKTAFSYGSQRRKYYQEPYVAADSLADSEEQGGGDRLSGR